MDEAEDDVLACMDFPVNGGVKMYRRGD